MQTKLLYLEDFSLLENQASVVELAEESGKTFVVLDQTIFYPQGGGQPFDTGLMKSESGVFAVNEVRFFEGFVKHFGVFESGSFLPGEKVSCSVDSARRLLNSRLHSAGHVADLALSQLKPEWVPGKGFHFPIGPYVEYSGSVEGVEKEKLAKEIEAKCREIIAQDLESKILFVPKEKLSHYCRHVPENLPVGKPTRIVQFGSFSVPCGGTHVKNLGEIKSMAIRKVKADGANVRVSYAVEMP